MRFMPNETDRARLIQKFRVFEKKIVVTPNDQEPRRRTQSIRSTGYFCFGINCIIFILLRSGYAFSQQKGWGPMITSGTLRTKSATNSPGRHDQTQ